MANKFPPKDPADVLDEKFEWGNWLATGDAITDAEVTVSPSGELTVSAISVVEGTHTADDGTETPVTDGAVICYVSGGELGTTYTLTCEVTTTNGLTGNRKATIAVKDL